jgi:hypothetical protein
LVASVGTMELTGLSAVFHSSWERMPSAEFGYIVEEREG